MKPRTSTVAPSGHPEEAHDPKHFASFILTLWAVGTIIGEGFSQMALILSLVFILQTRAWRFLEGHQKYWAMAVCALAAWQALSPLGASEFPWPRSGRYFQFLDTLAVLASFLVGSTHLPWRALWAVWGVGTALNFFTALHQHFFEWTLEGLSFLRLPVHRVREVFAVDGVERHGAGGLLFHRLRYSHGSVGLLGPFLAMAFSKVHGLGRRLESATATLMLSAAGYLAFARAATVATLALWMAAIILWLGGKARWAAGMGVLALLGALWLNPVWHVRVLKGVENVASGERKLAMSVGFDVARQNPWLGVGFGNHQKAAMTRAENTGITEYLATDSHNLWITTWAETGLVGLLLLLMTHAGLGFLLAQKARDRDPFVVGALLSWFGFHLLSLVHYLPYHTGVYLTFSMVWGLGLASGRRQSTN